MPDLDRYCIYLEDDGYLALGYSENEDDEGVLVDFLGDVASLSFVLEKIRAHQQSIGA